MHSPQIDLLSYAYIRTEVERLFKAYLDARLIELSKAHNKLVRAKKTNPLHYWEGVLSILDRTFGWQRPNPKAGSKDADKDADSEDSIAVLLRQLDAKAGVVNDPDTSPYLYWFDVRASYWSPVGDSKWTSLVDALPSAEHLALVFEQAKALKNRIQAERPDPLPMVSEDPGIAAGAKPPGSSDVVPAITGLKNILGKVEPHAAPGRTTGADDTKTQKR